MRLSSRPGGILTRKCGTRVESLLQNAPPYSSGQPCEVDLPAQECQNLYRVRS